METVSNSLIDNTHKVGNAKTPIAELLRDDFSMLRFAYLPFLSQFENDIRWMAKAVGIPVERALEYMEILIGTEFWVRSPSGKITVCQNYMRVMSNTGDYLSLVAGLQSRLTDDGPCTFHFEVIVTNDEIVANLNKKLAEAFSEFKSASAKVNGDTMVSYAYSLAYVLESACKKEVN